MSKKTSHGQHHLRHQKQWPKRPEPSVKVPRNPIADTAPCVTCGRPLYQHPRCGACNRFVWCTATQMEDGVLYHSHGCMAGVA